MKNRDIFILSTDSKLDRELSQYGQRLKRSVRKYYLFVNSTCMRIEKQDPQLCWSSLLKASIAIQSAIELIRLGYIGSAKAIFRQIYEYLLWVKIAVDADEDALEIIKEHFYQIQNPGFEQEQSFINVMDYFKPKNKKAPYRIIVHCDRKRFPNILVTEDELIEMSKDFYRELCGYTHASSAAQQPPIQGKEFYSEWRMTLVELIELHMLYVEVFEQYFDVAWDVKFKNTFEIQDKWSSYYAQIDIDHPLEKIHIQKLLEKIDPEAEPINFLVLAFSGMWEIQRRNINDKT